MAGSGKGHFPHLPAQLFLRPRGAPCTPAVLPGFCGSLGPSHWSGCRSRWCFEAGEVLGSNLSLWHAH